MDYSKSELPQETKTKKNSEISSQIAGWILLLGGILLIVWTLFSSYNIFTAKSSLPEFFGMPEDETAFQEEGTLNPQAQMEKAIQEQLKGLLPADFITKFLNLIVWSMLAWILLFGGGQISGLGIKLIKK
jgi:hypothetical protein